MIIYIVHLHVIRHGLMSIMKLVFFLFFFILSYSKSFRCSWYLWYVFRWNLRYFESWWNWYWSFCWINLLGWCSKSIFLFITYERFPYWYCFHIYCIFFSFHSLIHLVSIKCYYWFWYYFTLITTFYVWRICSCNSI